VHTHTNTTWKKAAAIPTTLALAVGGVLLVVPTATAATPAESTVTEEALVTDSTSAAVVETPADAPATPAPAIETPAVEAPVDETPAAAPAVEAPVAETPALDEPALDEPVAAEPDADEPAAAEPVADAAAEPVADEQADTDTDVDAAAEAAAIATAPILTSPTAGSVVRSAARGESDTAAPVTFTGTGQPGAVVTVRADPIRGWYSPTKYALAPVGSDGRWTATLELGSIEWITTVRQYAPGADGQPSGAPSPESRTRFQHVVAYQAAPGPVTVVSPTAGALFEPTRASGATRLGGPVTIVVRGIPGAKVEMSWRDTSGSQRGPSGDITVPASGVLTHVATIPTGEWRFSARQYLVDDTGRRISSRSAVSGGRDFTVRPVTLPAPAVTSVADGGVLVAAGQYPQDAVFGPRPAVREELVGTGTPGAAVQIMVTSDDGDVRGELSAVVDADGTWRVVPFFEPGEYVLSSRQIDVPTTSPVGFSGVNAGSASVITRVSVVLPGERPGTAPAGVDGSAQRPGSTVGGSGGTTLPAAAPVDAAPVADDSLAFTGSEGTATAGLLAALLVALGLGSLVVSRRRRATRGPAA
jgi:hypothetical protein